MADQHTMTDGEALVALRVRNAQTIGRLRHGHLLGATWRLLPGRDHGPGFYYTDRCLDDAGLLTIGPAGGPVTLWVDGESFVTGIRVTLAFTAHD